MHVKVNTLFLVSVKFMYRHKRVRGIGVRLMDHKEALNCWNRFW